MNLQDVVTGVALVLSIASFGVFLLLALGLAGAKTETPVSEGAAEAARKMSQPVSPAELEGLLKAFASLSESLAKAAPSLAALIGSVLFLAIASISSGVLQSHGPEVEEEAPAADLNHAGKV